MKISKKLILISMLVMLVCCVSTVSATDTNGTDDVSDVIEVDDVTDVIEDAEIDDANEDVVEEQETNPVTTGTINGQAWENYVYNNTGYLITSNDLTFSGDFYAQSFGNIKIDKPITVNAQNATFHNIGFDLSVSQIILNGGTFIFDENAAVNAVIYDLGSENTVKNTVINVTAPANTDFYAMNFYQPNGAQILNNTIYYVDTNENAANYNYVVKIKGGSHVNMIGNTIVAFVPLKDVDYSHWTPEPTIDYDLVAGVAVENSNYFNFANNTLNVTGNARVGWLPTLDAMIIVKSDNVNITGNKIYEGDDVSGEEETNYLYAIDIYRCNNILIDDNKIDLNSKGGNLTINGTGAAYGIQLTGPHTGVVISNNNITTASNGPNLGIYSQNTQGATNLTIKGNIIKVTGRAGDNPWALVSGMELQDTYATVCNNNIEVNNIRGYSEGYYAFGISYCQHTDGNHIFKVTNNTVRVTGGKYAVYLDNVTNSNVSYNSLRSYLRIANNSVYITGDSSNYVGNNTP